MNTDFVADALANEDLTVEAIYTNHAGDVTFPRVLFREPSSLSSSGGEAGYRNSSPTATVDADDFPTAVSHVNAETLEIEDVVYNIIDVESLDTGRVLRLTLSKIAVAPE